MRWFHRPTTRLLLTIIISVMLIGAISSTALFAQTPSASVMPSVSASPPPTAMASPTMTMSPTTTASPSTTAAPSATAAPSVTAAPSAASAGAGTPPPEVTQFAKDWPLSNGDYANTRATTNSTINASNVKNLGAVWAHNVPSGQSTFGSISTTPIIMGNTVYIQDIGNNIFALDLATGQQKWQKIYNLANTGPNGVSIGYGKVFGSAGPYDVAALDASTGKEVWRTTLIDITKDPSQGVNGIDMQTTVYDGLVYISTVPGNAGVFYAGGGKGVLYALDQATGKVVWSFNTVGTPDWVALNPNINSGGGAWYTPAIDTATGQMYWGIVNPAPFPGQPKASGIPQDFPNGSSRPGPNLYTNTMMAMDHATGKMTWFTQVRPHDINDYDLQAPPILTTAEWGGKQQDIVIGAGKMGQVYAFNRQTGAIIWQTAVGEHNNDTLDTFPTDGTITVLPGILGGVETPMAHADGVVYVLANNLATDNKNGLTLSLHPFSENTSNLEAINVNTGRVMWNVALPSGGYGAATVVNDLVFTGTFDGMLYAFNRMTGEQLWSYQAPAGVNAWPAVAGDTIVWPIAGTGVPSVIAFKVGGAAPAPAVQIVSPADGVSVPAGDITVTAQPLNFNLIPSATPSSSPSASPTAAPSPSASPAASPSPSPSIFPGFTNAVPGAGSTSMQGKFIYYLDQTPPTTAGQPATTASGTFQVSDQTSVTWKNVAAGTHKLSVQLVNADNTPLNPPAVKTITVTADTNPRVTISVPPNGVIKRAGPLAITVTVSNFSLGAATPSVSASPGASASPAASPSAMASPSAAASPSPSAGAPSATGTASPAPGASSAAAQGKIIYYMDVTPPSTPGQSGSPASGNFHVTNATSFTFTDVPIGIHTFYVQLVDNNGNVLSTPAMAQIQTFQIQFTGGFGQQ